MGPVETLGIEEESKDRESSPRPQAHPSQDGHVGPGHRPTLRTLALAAVARLAEANPALNRESQEWLYLAQCLTQVPADNKSWVRTVLNAFKESAPEDGTVVQLAAALSCTAVETLSVVLAAAVDQELMVGRALAYIQTPVGGARPTLGLLAAAYVDLADRGCSALDVLLTGTAIRSGLLVLGGEDGPIPERPISVPQTIGLALRGYDGIWPGTTIGMGAESDVTLPPSVSESAVHHAQRVTAMSHQSLVIRSGFLTEAKSAAGAIASVLRCRPLFIETEKIAGMTPWLILRGLIPVFVIDMAPGERRNMPEIPGYAGPVLAVTMSEGTVERNGRAVACWVVPVPTMQERRDLWHRAIGTRESADALAKSHRHSSARIQILGTLARREAILQGRSTAGIDDVVAVSVSGVGIGLGTLAQPLCDPIPDKALVVPEAVQRELAVLVSRCRLREGLALPLGVAVAARYRPGVRALFVGPSGTGKTVAAGWLATKLGLPLYRVDLASVTSKYIGETEKNLAQLFAQAERSEVVLLFDEADSLFGKRTDIKDSNDRFANAQTNYVLQRIESYDGIVILTSNSRSRFDSAFSRRLDMIIEFPTPGPEERRDLWLAHLGNKHAVTPSELNQLAAMVDLAGGHIRNVVLTAAVVAQRAGRVIGLSDLTVGLAAEYRKLGRQMPVELMPSPRL